MILNKQEVAILEKELSELCTEYDRCFDHKIRRLIKEDMLLIKRALSK